MMDVPASLPLNAEAHQPIAPFGCISPPHVLHSVMPHASRSANTPPSRDVPHVVCYTLATPP